MNEEKLLPEFESTSVIEPPEDDYDIDDVVEHVFSKMFAQNQADVMERLDKFDKAIEQLAGDIDEKITRHAVQTFEPIPHEHTKMIERLDALEKKVELLLDVL